MRVLLVGPDRATAQVNGDDIVTRLLRARPPDGVAYETLAEALAAGHARRDRWASAWLASLVMHSRPPAGVAYGWGLAPPLPYRLLGKLLPDRPDEDIQWFDLPDPRRYDLIHAWSHPVGLGPRRVRPPVVLHTGTGNTDLLLNYYGIAAGDVSRLQARDRWLLGSLGVLHDLYNADQAAAVVVPSRYAWDLHVALGVPERLLRLVRIGFAAPPASEVGRLRVPGEVRFALVGHHFARKGGRALAIAFDRLRRAHPEARLTIVSAVPPEALGVPLDGISLIQALPRDAVYGEVYPAADVYLLPSLAEGYGMSVVEAMSFGLPVIASRLSALPELVADGETGLLVPPDDADALHDAMRQLLVDPALRARMGAAGRARFLAEHEVGVTNAVLKKVYDQAVSS